MEFFKKNYEKILLALVLIGLTAAVGFLLIFIPEKQKELKEFLQGYQNKQAAPLAVLDTQPEEAALQRLHAPFTLDLTTKHRLFNPVLWQIAPNGTLRKIVSEDQQFPAGLKIISINPIYMTVTFTSTNSVGWVLRVEDPTLPRNRSSQTVVIHMDGSANQMFNLKRIVGSADNPTALDLESKDKHETFTLQADQPYKRVVGYTADLKYPQDPSAPGWPNVRIGTVLHYEGADYSVIDVKDNSVLISARSNYKHTTIFFSRTSD